MKEGFLTSLDTAMLFYRTCSLYRVKDLPARITLMRKITARGRAKYIRDAEHFIEGKKVVGVTKGGRKHVSN